MTIERQPLKVLICGAGIGGLSAAIAFRQQGHDVEMFEQSKFSYEIGAAIHLPPNAYSMLEHLGVPFDNLGGNTCEYITELTPEGKIMAHVATKDIMKEYRHPWLLVHRANLHTALRERATSADGPGKPVKINLSARVQSADCDEGKITLETGEVFQGDLVVAADGVHSLIRNDVTGTVVPPSPSGHSAFRFLIPKEQAEAIEEFKPYYTKTGDIQIWLAEDRRVVIYPCKDNEQLNFVCIHPDSFSSSSTEGWANKGSREDVVECYKSFHPALGKLFAIAEDVKLWKLLDRPTLTTWIKGRVGLLGDAAHSFLPHQGQGGAQAIEDGVAFATAFPLGVKPADVPEFLKVYEKARLERATTIQAYTREQAKYKAGSKLDPAQFSHFNWCHNAYFHTSKVLARHLESRSHKRMPVGWGPIQGPRQDYLGYPIDLSDTKLRTGFVRIKTSKSYAEQLLPNDKFRIDVPGDICYMTFSNTWSDNIEWLGGRDYSHFDIYIENVVYTADSGKEQKGRFLTLLLEGRTEPTLSGREELGMPKIFTTLTETFDQKSGYSVKASWEGSTFLELKVSDCALAEPSGPAPPGAMEWRCMPKPGKKGEVDIEYATWTPEPPGGAEFKLDKYYEGAALIEFFKDKINLSDLPCHYHIARKLSEIPIYGLETGKVITGTGLPDLCNHAALEL